MILVTKRVAVAPLELKLGPNESYGRAASVKPPPGAKKAQIQAKIVVKLQGSAAWTQPLKLALVVARISNRQPRYRTIGT